MRWIVKEIAEADYGCEERLPGEPLMAIVTIESEDDRIFTFEMPDNWLTLQGIDEGDEWPEDLDEVDHDSLLADKLAEIMEKYYEAIEELEEIV